MNLKNSTGRIVRITDETREEVKKEIKIEETKSCTLEEIRYIKIGKKDYELNAPNKEVVGDIEIKFSENNLILTTFGDVELASFSEVNDNIW